MNDEQIIALYWERNENAIVETETKYGRYLLTIADNVLRSLEDARECETDTYFAAWNAIPPHRPTFLRAFLGKITRNLALKKLRYRTAAKRKENEALLSLDELADCIPSNQEFDSGLECEELAAHIGSFLRTLGETERNIFIRRYWYLDPILDISRRFGLGESHVKTKLMRTRRKLARYLQEKGVLS